MSHGVDPSHKGGIVSFFRSIPGKISSFWKGKVVSLSNSGISSKIKVLFKKDNYESSVGKPNNLTKKNSISKDESNESSRMQKFFKQDALENPVVESSRQPIDFNKFNKRWDHLKPDVQDEFKQMSNDSQFILEGAKKTKNPAWLMRAGDQIKNDPSFVAEALKINPAFAEERNNIDPITPEVLQDDKVQAQFRENIKYQNRGFAQNANAEKNLRFVPFDIAKEYLEQHPEAFGYASEIVRGDPEVVKHVLKMDPRQIESVHWDGMSLIERPETMQAHEDLEQHPAYFQFAPREWLASHVGKVEEHLKTYNGQETLQRIAIKMPQEWKSNRTQLFALAKENKNLFEAFIHTRLLSYEDVRTIVKEQPDFNSNVAFRYTTEGLMRGE